LPAQLRHELLGALVRLLNEVTDKSLGILQRGAGPVVEQREILRQAPISPQGSGGLHRSRRWAATSWRCQCWPVR
jgi:hypothetical protein